MLSLASSRSLPNRETKCRPTECRQPQPLPGPHCPGQPWERGCVGAGRANVNSHQNARKVHPSLSETTLQAWKDLDQSRASFLEHCNSQSFLLPTLRGAQHSYSEWRGCQRTPDTVVERRGPTAKSAAKHSGSVVAASLGSQKSAKHRTPRQTTEGNAAPLRPGSSGSPRHLDPTVPRRPPATSQHRREERVASQECCPFLERIPDTVAKPASDWRSRPAPLQECLPRPQ